VPHMYGIPDPIRAVLLRAMMLCQSLPAAAREE
jgi:hypothetical protein